MATEAQHYYVPNPSLYPFILSVGLLLLASGFIFDINQYAPGVWMMLLGALCILYMLYSWFGSVIAESEGGQYSAWEDRSFRIGMIAFISSEVAFFAAFFGALFFLRNIAIPELANFDPEFTMYKDFSAAWPSAGPGGAAALGEYTPPPFTPMAAWGLPAINTLILLSSGATITWAHWGLLKNNRQQLIIGLFLTVLLGSVFLGLQAYEYYHAYTDLGLTLSAGAYGATFFMLTGFHGFHVLLGTMMLIVVLLRSIKGHFKPDHHFAFEGVAWYWHFVDVVWLLLFVLVYWL